jgi:hypothetical protein
MVLFALVFWFTLELDLRHDSALAQAVKSHLLYSLRAKDDMGTIDWGKALESTPGVKAFSVSKDGSPIVVGGNQQIIPAQSSDGSRFKAPSSILYETAFSIEGTGKFRFVVISEPLLDPWKSAGLSSLLFLLLGSFFLLRKQKVDPQPTSNPITKEQKEKSRVPEDLRPVPENRSQGLPTNGLLLDPQFKILRFGPKTPALLGLSAENLSNGHLLDLLPDPSLLQAFEKAEKQKILGAFPKAPRLSIALEPTQEGFLLTLETISDSQTPKKP